jgi:hypothetical protein
MDLILAGSTVLIAPQQCFGRIAQKRMYCWWNGGNPAVFDASVLARPDVGARMMKEATGWVVCGALGFA